MARSGPGRSTLPLVGLARAFISSLVMWVPYWIFIPQLLITTEQIGSNFGRGFDFINGYTFLERFYSVYDTTNSRVGFATTAQTTATSN